MFVTLNISLVRMLLTDFAVLGIIIYAKIMRFSVEKRLTGRDFMGIVWTDRQTDRQTG